MSTKQIGTLCSRKQHFIQFLNRVKLGNNYALKGFTLTTRNVIMACYTAYLGTGETLLCKSIKADTIVRYLNAAVEFSTSAQLMNPCLDIMGNQSTYIKDILREIRRWESVPNRKEPLTKKMVKYIINKGKTLNRVNHNNIYTVLGDWLVVGLQAGFRRKEWAQDRTYVRKHKDIERNIDKSSSAFILEDFEFRGKGNKRINNSSTNEIKKASTVNIKWRFQKNNDNGQVISYVKDNVNKTYCVVEACQRLRNRAINLRIAKDKPIAVFTEIINGKSITRLVDDIHIKRLLQEAASKEYNIKCKKELSAFTSHSVRVGACVLLHSQNISPEDIKFWLRWRSDTFRMYLRNIVELAERHRDAIANA